MKLIKRHYGWIEDQEIIEYHLVNNQGAVFKCLNYGAIVTAILVPDKNRSLENVVLGFDRLSDYLAYPSYFGALIGRVAGRIRKGQWLDHQLTLNEGKHHIHGGEPNFSHLVWETKEITNQTDKLGIQFSHHSPAGENGYPGNLIVTVTYFWTNNHTWIMNVEAQTDEQTLFNPTNHTYFNLSGDTKRTIETHQLQMSSEVYAETDDEKYPTGRLLAVEDTVYDFREPTSLRKALNKNPKGYDTPFKLQEGKVVLNEQESGRRLEIKTTRESVVVFSTTGMEEDYFINGKKMCSHLGLALETQELPDAVHHEHFQSIILEPNKPHSSQTSYHFSV
ncbi:aldose 1-epimerase [Carnobacterium iners]|uniref:Aldose 1-epimerase n=1 Tax=Carnobacterium iners TaxID=1073423 RepID=A0A1X7N6L9_9LACT|nr:aldose epimerase family protein [Carnobacterium iners]SEK61093.1 aldose 1-epimerase [Carnobacterium iners]SMH32216.1 aldose 1-epimerase [Carnobacterium iners]